jgi:hypothetical protein
MCRPATDPPTPGWGYGYGQGWINTTRTRTLLYPGGTGMRVQQPVTIPKHAVSSSLWTVVDVVVVVDELALAAGYQSLRGDQCT